MNEMIATIKRKFVVWLHICGAEALSRAVVELFQKLKVSSIYFAQIDLTAFYVREYVTHANKNRKPLHVGICEK